MIRYFLQALIGCIIVGMMSCSNKKKVDLLVINGKIHTIDPAFSTAEAFAISNGQFVDIGTSEQLFADYEAKEVIDAQGMPIYPGLYDAHAHFVGLGEKLASADLVGTKSWEEVVDRVKAFAQTHPEAKWICGRGWDQNDWGTDGAFPNNQLLNELFPETPVYLVRIDGHAAIANKIAMAQAGISSTTEVKGGKVLLENGFPSGVLVDNATDLVRNIIPEPSEEEFKRQLLEAQAQCLSYGLTTIVDAGLRRPSLEMIEKMQKEGLLKIRIYAMIDPLDKVYYLNKGLTKTDRLNIRSFKLYADGALGSRGAALLMPYQDDADNMGLLVTEPSEMKAFMQEAVAKGFQVNTHCIGDSANRLVLDLYGEILGEGNGNRWRIEHAQVVSPEDLEKFKKYRVIPSVQPTHATSDMYWAGERLGEERAKNAYPFKALMEQNDLIVFGTDFPVEAVSPFYTFHAAVARQDAKGYPKEGYQMENAVDRKSALKAMTSWAAFSCFEEAEKGSIEIGKWADFVILNKDLLTAPTDSLRGIEALATYIAGEQVYHK